MSVRFFKSLIIIGVLLALATASFNLHPLRHSLAQDPPNPPSQKIESDDARVAQSGAWSSQTTSSASAGSYLFSSGSEADILSLAFEGSALEILYIAGPSLGTLAIEVDGTVLRTVITAETETRYGQSAKVSYLTDEPHTLKVYAQAGGVIAIDAFVITPVEASTEPPDEVVGVSAEQPTELRNCPFVDTEIQRLSVGPGNVQANGSSGTPHISADGRYVVFTSGASNLGTFPPRAAVHMLDRQTCIISAIGFTRNIQDGGITRFVRMTDDANYVVMLFVHMTIPVCIPHFGCIPTPPAYYVLEVYNRSTGTTTVLEEGTSRSFEDLWLNGNRYLALEHPYNNGAVNLTLLDLTTNTRTDVNVGPNGSYLSNAYDFSHTPDGRYIAFKAVSPSLCINSHVQVFLYDRQTQTTECISRASDGTPANLSASYNSDRYYRPLITPDGRYVAFGSRGNNLAPGDTNGVADIFVRDRQTGQTQRVSIGVGGVQFQYDSFDLFSFSADGNYVLFSTSTDNFVPGTAGWNRDLYLLNRITDEIRWLSSPNDGSTYFGVMDAGMTPDARLVVFSAEPPNLVPNDTNNAVDVFSIPGIVNPVVPAEGDSLALFRPDLDALSLVTTLQDLPPAHGYLTYTTNPPPNSMEGVWVMGDWDGDGDDTPGVYGALGVFYYTNDVSATATWGEIWIGLSRRPAVVGRFNAAVNHDCIGVVDSANFPPYGTAFALYFTCDLTNGTAPTLVFQWLSVILPDSGGFSGTHQFAAGDFNNDGVDSIAVRRGEFISFGNVPPTTLLSEFNLAQYWGVPSVTGGEAGIFLAGDFDNTAGDSFGVFYQNGHFYYRNSVEWSPAGHLLQRVGQPIGTPVQAGSWR